MDWITDSKVVTAWRDGSGGNGDKRGKGLGLVIFLSNLYCRFQVNCNDYNTTWPYSNMLLVSVSTLAIEIDVKYKCYPSGSF